MGKMPLVRFEFAICPPSRRCRYLLFVRSTGLKMTPVTLERVIDDSKRERKVSGRYGKR